MFYTDEKNTFFKFILALLIFAVSIKIAFVAFDEIKNVNIKTLTFFKGNLYFTKQGCKQYKIKNCELDNVYWMAVDNSGLFGGDKYIVAFRKKDNSIVSTPFVYGKNGDVLNFDVKKVYKFKVEENTYKPVEKEKIESFVNDMAKTFNMPVEKVKEFLQNKNK